MTFNKTQFALGIATAALTMAGALVSPQALAHSKSERIAEATNNKVDAMEAQLRAMQAEISSLKAQAAVPAAESEKVQELEQWMQQVKSTPKPVKSKDNMVFFRSGFAQNDQAPISTTSNLSCNNGIADGGAVGCPSSSRQGWMFGAGFDFSIDDNLFGLMDNTELLAELMFDYNQFGKYQGNVAGLVVNGAPSYTATQSMMRLVAAPKIKFLKGNKIRPWVIPFGFVMNILSPPSQLNTITELNPGMHFGTGVDYNIWKNVYIGADARYNYAFNKLDGTNTNGFTVGGQLGLGF